LVADAVRGALGPSSVVDVRPMTVEERTLSLERRISEIEIIAGIFIGALVLMWLLSRR
jgi:hypothetical protein